MSFQQKHATKPRDKIIYKAVLTFEELNSYHITSCEDFVQDNSIAPPVIQKKAIFIITISAKLYGVAGRFAF